MLDAIAWRPSGSLSNLRQRAALMAQLRRFMTTFGYLEVETPIMARHGVSDVYLQNLSVSFRQEPYYLQTSPEYHMKRLLASGSGPIFQLARVFRDDELGRWHNPEFTLLEWYQLGVDHHAMMDEVDTLLQDVLQTQPMKRKTYQEAFLECCGVNPLHASIESLSDALERFHLRGVLPENETDLDQYLFLLMSHVVEPALASSPMPIAIYHFPPSQAALAEVKENVAQRFEVYFKGIELANGFHELRDPVLQRDRFIKDNALREAKGIPASIPDAYFLRALEQGLPQCSGVALGVDRLLALLLNAPSLADVMAFGFSNA